MIEATEQLGRQIFHSEELDKFALDSYSRKIKRPGDYESSLCYSLVKDDNTWRMSTSYFIGVDWLDCPRLSLRLSPKFNHQEKQIEIDYL